MSSGSAKATLLGHLSWYGYIDRTTEDTEDTEQGDSIHCNLSVTSVSSVVE